MRPQFSAGVADRAAIARLVERARKGDLHLVTGGQRGYDLWVAEAALAAGVAYVVVIPWSARSFTSAWAPADRARFERVAAGAAALVELGPGSGYIARDRWMVDHAVRLVAFWPRADRGRRGGTVATMRYALSRGKPVFEATEGFVSVAASMLP